MNQKIAVVTGASSGIGRATAIALADSGFTVIAAARRIDRLEELAQSNPAIIARELDVTSDASVAAFYAALNGEKIDVLVNNAGGAFDAAPIATADPEIWRKTYEVNVIGTVRMVKAALTVFAEPAHIVIVTSTAALAAYENGGSYVAAKSAELSLARTLRLELNGKPIRVSEIAPGMVKTEEFSKVRLGGDEDRAAKVYEGVADPLTAEDIAESIRWTVTLPDHVNIDTLVIRPVAQAANHKVHRTL
jgi:NADP-dependent 3-hydroxy acid dehydrogenase YdfG